MTGFLDAAGRAVFKLTYEISPIILTDGIASSIPGGMLPIVALTEGANFAAGLLDGSFDIGLDDFFAHFEPAPGGVLINNQPATYPAADQSVAANAIVCQPLNISLMMRCPGKTSGAYTARLVTFTALKKALDMHTVKGGLYTVVTPSYVYTNCILTSLQDVSAGDTKQPQTAWQFDFVQPLVTEAQISQSQNNAMSKISGGMQTTGGTSGPSAVSGTSNIDVASSSGKVPVGVLTSQPAAGTPSNGSPTLFNNGNIPSGSGGGYSDAGDTTVSGSGTEGSSSLA